MFKAYESYQFPIPDHTKTGGLTPITAGHLKAKPNYICKPRILDDYYLIYVQSGCGSFKINNIRHNIQKGDLVFLFPGVVHTCKTDASNLLEEIWVGFSGTEARPLIDAMGISLNTPLLHTGSLAAATEELLNKLIHEASTHHPGASSIIKGLLYQLFGMLATEDDTLTIMPTFIPGDHPIERAVNYIEAHFTEAVTINDLADYVALSRSHFATRFKKEVGKSPKAYLTDLRLEQAAFMLSGTTLSVTDIAASVGITDPLYFSKVFHKRYGDSPVAYRDKYSQLPPASGSKGSF